MSDLTKAEDAYGDDHSGTNAREYLRQLILAAEADSKGAVTLYLNHAKHVLMLSEGDQALVSLLRFVDSLPQPTWDSLPGDLALWLNTIIKEFKAGKPFTQFPGYEEKPPTPSTPPLPPPPKRKRPPHKPKAGVVSMLDVAMWDGVSFEFNP